MDVTDAAGRLKQRAALPAARRAHADANGEQRRVHSTTPDKLNALEELSGACAHEDSKDTEELRGTRFPSLIYAVMLRDLAATPPLVPATLAALYGTAAGQRCCVASREEASSRHLLAPSGWRLANITHRQMRS
ncbi:hypothetical protein QQF64_001768 [Cirrhinus molitorella]|uniref:Uncharacterized protein n=1 Tax=Cirrhinus molitorella TaxID=172907 RepID=A0ABR3MN88_9TELE